MKIERDIMSAEYMDAAKRFNVNEDSCKNPDHYNTYIWQDAITDQNTGMGVTHVFVDEEADLDIAGYITLRASSLIKEMGGSHKYGFPALEIAELAVSKKYEGSGIGRSMVQFAIAMACDLNQSFMSCMYVLVCADPDAVDFYRHLNFNDIRPMIEAIPREHWNLNCVPMLMKITQM